MASRQPRPFLKPNCSSSDSNHYQDSQPFHSRANSFPGVNWPIGPWPSRSLELSLPGFFTPWFSRSQELSLPERNGPGTFVLYMELSFSRVFAPRNVRSLELSFPVMSMILIYDIRLDCTPCCANVLMIYCC